MFKKLLITSSILLSAVANAGGGYVGLSAGQTNVDLSGFDDGDSIAIIGGFKINQNFAVEASYVDLGESKDNVAPVWTIEADGFNFAAVGLIPINDKIDIFGKVGVFIWDVTLNESGYGEIASDDGTDLSYGIGATANFTDQFSLVLEYQKFDLGDDDVTNISLGARFNF